MYWIRIFGGFVLGTEKLVSERYTGCSKRPDFLVLRTKKIYMLFTIWSKHLEQVPRYVLLLDNLP